MSKRTIRTRNDETGSSGVGGTCATVQQLSRTSDAERQLIWRKCLDSRLTSISEKECRHRVVFLYKACEWTTGRKRSHSDSTQLTVSSSGDVIVESALRSCKARSSSSSSSIRERKCWWKNMSSCEKSRKSSLSAAVGGCIKHSCRTYSSGCDVGLTLRHGRRHG